MKKEAVVISLGGSLIYPESLKKVNEPYMKKFESYVKLLLKKYKVVVICGGGYPARSYMGPLTGRIKDKMEVSIVGVQVTRINALFVNKWFKINDLIPLRTREVKKRLKKKNLAICGALEVGPNQTSDSNAANLARVLKAKFVNLTDVNGLHDKDPKKNKNAKFIKQISYQDFNKMVSKIKFHNGQHFVLDQTATNIICKNKIPTAIIKGSNLKDIEKFLKGKNFRGTLIGEL